MYRKEIIYDAGTRDYAMYLDGELTGFARTYSTAEGTLDALVFQILTDLAPVPSPQTATDRTPEGGSHALMPDPADDLPSAVVLDPNAVGPDGVLVISYQEYLRDLSVVS